MSRKEKNIISELKKLNENLSEELSNNTELMNFFEKRLNECRYNQKRSREKKLLKQASIIIKLRAEVEYWKDEYMKALKQEKEDLIREENRLKSSLYSSKKKLPDFKELKKRFSLLSNGKGKKIKKKRKTKRKKKRKTKRKTRKKRK